MAEDVRALTRRFMEEVFNKGNMSVAEELIAPGATEHSPPPDSTGSALEDLRGWLTEMRNAFPDLVVSIDDMIVEGDKVVVRSTMTGTHKEAFMGIPATGRQISVPGIDIMRVKDGKYTDHWGVADSAAMMGQLGAMPPPG